MKCFICGKKFVNLVEAIPFLILGDNLLKEKHFRHLDCALTDENVEVVKAKVDLKTIPHNVTQFDDSVAPDGDIKKIIEDNTIEEIDE